MSSRVGITNKFGLTSPASSFAHETSQKSSVEWVPVKNEAGVTVENDPLPYTKLDISMRGAGSPNFALVVAGVVTTGTLKIISMKEDQSHKGKPTFEINAEKYVNAA